MYQSKLSQKKGGKLLPICFGANTSHRIALHCTTINNKRILIFPKAKKKIELKQRRTSHGNEMLSKHNQNNIIKIGKIN